MNRYIWLVLVSLFMIGFISCTSEKKTEIEVQGEAVSTQSDSAKAICKACGMEMPQNVMLTHEIDGEKVYFCNEFCRDHYLARAAEGK